MTHHMLHEIHLPKNPPRVLNKEELRLKIPDNFKRLVCNHKSSFCFFCLWYVSLIATHPVSSYACYAECSAWRGSPDDIRLKRNLACLEVQNIYYIINVWKIVNVC